MLDKALSESCCFPDDSTPGKARVPFKALVLAFHTTHSLNNIDLMP